MFDIFEEAALPTLKAVMAWRSTSEKSDILGLQGCERERAKSERPAAKEKTPIKKKNEREGLTMVMHVSINQRKAASEKILVGSG